MFYKITLGSKLSKDRIVYLSKSEIEILSDVLPVVVRSKASFVECKWVTIREVETMGEKNVPRVSY